MLVLTRRLAYSPQKQGGLASGDRTAAQNVVVAFVGAVLGQPFKVKVGCVGDWEWQVPRPQPPAPHTFLLEVEVEGSIDIAGLCELVNTDMLDQHVDAKEVCEQWHCLVSAFQENGKVNIKDILCIHTNYICPLGDKHVFWSLWRQLLVPVIFKLEQQAAILTKTDHPIPSSLVVSELVFDEEGGWSLSEVDKVCRKHVADSFAAARCHSVVHFAIDKVAGRGNQLQNGFAVLANNIAFEFVPHALSSK